MGAFSYQALDQAGRIRNGVLEGDTPRQVRQILRDQGLSPLAVEGVAVQERSSGTGLRLRRRIGAADLALATRQLATLVRSGTVLEEALRTVAEQTENRRLQSILLTVRSRILEGHTVAGALAEFPKVFPEMYRATLAAGEQAGYLDAVLERLADYTELRQVLRQKIMLALLYPVLLTGVALVVIGALLAYVVPQIVEVFVNLGQELPLLTRLLIGVSAFLKTYGLVLIGGLIIAALLWKAALRNQEIRRRCHRLLLNLPLIGKFSRSLNAARFARSFSILIAAGVPVVDGMRISAQVLTNLILREKVEEAADRVREGSSLHRALARGSYFPPLALHLIASGEASSNLEEMLERAAASLEREIETLIATAMGLFEPLLILSMGGLVLVIVLAILLPIFELNQLVH